MNKTETSLRPQLLNSALVMAIRFVILHTKYKYFTGITPNRSDNINLILT